MEPHELKPGDYFFTKYGFSIVEFYVTENHPSYKLLFVRNRKWLVSAFTTLDYKKINPLIYIGKGKKRWWRFLLPLFADLIPIYSKPN
jgi:hypothetical protein